MLVAGGVQLLCAVAAVALGSRVGMQFSRDLRLALFDRVTEMSMDGVGVRAVLAADPDHRRRAGGGRRGAAVPHADRGATGVGGVVMAARQDLGLAWVLLLAVPILAVATG